MPRTAPQTTPAAALAEILASVPTLMAWAQEHAAVGQVRLQRRWHAPSGTYSYHTTAAVEAPDAGLLDRCTTLFQAANRLPAQPWYPAFLGGDSTPIELPAPATVSRLACGWARFDFGLRRHRCYRQLIATVEPAADTRIVALRSIREGAAPGDAVLAYTLAPTADVLQWRDGRLLWHHIVTVYGAALLPPAADRLLMNLLRALRLDIAERRTYLDEAGRFRRFCGSAEFDSLLRGLAPPAAPRHAG